MDRIRITLRSDLCAGNGESRGNTVDTDPVLTPCGLPRIPARRLKGCLRAAAAQLAELGDPAAACTADGASIFVETIFENRYKYVDELIRMGAQIRVDGRVAVTVGVPQLQSGRVECTDLRGGAALVVAALAAQGESRICGIAHLDRGYAALPEQLCAVGADVRRAPDRP